MKTRLTDTEEHESRLQTELKTTQGHLTKERSALAQQREAAQQAGKKLNEAKVARLPWALLCPYLLSTLLTSLLASHLSPLLTSLLTSAFIPLLASLLTPLRTSRHPASPARVHPPPMPPLR